MIGCKNITFTQRVPSPQLLPSFGRLVESKLVSPLCRQHRVRMRSASFSAATGGGGGRRRNFDTNFHQQGWQGSTSCGAGRNRSSTLLGNTGARTSIVGWISFPAPLQRMIAKWPIRGHSARGIRRMYPFRGLDVGSKPLRGHFVQGCFLTSLFAKARSLARRLQGVVYTVQPLCSFRHCDN